MFDGREGGLKGLLGGRGHGGVGITLAQEPRPHQALQVRGEVLPHPQNQHVHGCLGCLPYPVVYVLWEKKTELHELVAIYHVYLNIQIFNISYVESSKFIRDQCLWIP